MSFVKTYWVLILATAWGVINVAQLGLMMGWTAPYLPFLLSEDSYIEMTQDDGSWLASFGYIGMVIMAPFSALLVHKLGRKFLIATGAALQIISLIITATATSVELLFVSRVIVGIAATCELTAVPIYVGEIAIDKIRGILGSMMLITQNTGILWIYVIGGYTSIEVSSYLTMIPFILVLLFFYWIPESPYYLVMKGKTKEAHKSLQILRQNENVDDELGKIEITVENQMSNKSSWKDLFTDRCSRKAFIISFGLYSALQFTGGAAYIQYMHIILEPSKDILPVEITAILYTVVQLLVSFILSALIDSLGRRPLLIWSCFLVCILNIIFGLHLLLWENISWLPVALLILFGALGTGVNCTSLVCLSELFPVRTKALGVTLCRTGGLVEGIAILKLFQLVFDNYGRYYPFFAFAILCAVSTVLGFFFMPESRGLSFEEIQNDLYERTIYIKKRKPNIDTKC